MNTSFRPVTALASLLGFAALVWGIVLGATIAAPASAQPTAEDKPAATISQAVLGDPTTFSCAYLGKSNVVPNLHVYRCFDSLAGVWCWIFDEPAHPGDQRSMTCSPASPAGAARLPGLGASQ